MARSHRDYPSKKIKSDSNPTNKKSGAEKKLVSPPPLPNRILDDHYQNIHSILPRGMKFLSGDHDDPPKNFSEENKRKSYNANSANLSESMRVDLKEDIHGDVPVLGKSNDEALDTSRKSITEHNREVDEALKNAFGREEEQKISDTSRKSIEEHTRETDEAMKTAFGNTEVLPDDQKVNPPSEGYFGSPDYKEAIDDQADIRQENQSGIDKDGIVEGFGVVGEAAPEIVMEEGMKGLELQEKKENGEEEMDNVLEGEYIPEREESLQELRDRARSLKGSSDEARTRFLRLQYQNTSRWLAIKKALFSLRSKEPPESMVNELEVLKSDWNYKLTLYKNSVVELAKREAAERKFDGKERGALMAEAIRGLDVQGSIENYDAWKNASWGDRKDSGFLRMLGRARDWAEQYRKLDWKKRVAISAVVVGTGVAGVAVGSAGLVGLGVAGSTIVRLLGAYGAGRGSYEFLEGRANQKTLQYNEAALSNVEKIEDIGFLEQRMKSYADRTQKDLDRAIAGNRKRVVASVALGSLLFLGGTAFAHRDAIQEFLEQMKIITGLENFHGVPVLVNTPGLTEPILNETTPQPNIPTFSPTESIPLQSKPVDVPLPPSPSLDANSSLAPTYQNVESVTNMFPDMMKGGDVVVARGNSIQGTLIEHFRKLGFSDANAGKFASRVSDAFGKDHPNVNLGKVFENTKIHLEPSLGSSGPLSAPFKIEGIEFAPSGPHGTSTIVGTMASEKPAVSTPLQPKPFDIPPSVPTEFIPLQPKPFDIPAAPSSVETSSPASFSKIPETKPNALDVFDKFSQQASVETNPLIHTVIENVPQGPLPQSMAVELPAGIASDIFQESQQDLQENLYAPLNRYQELLPYFHGVFDHVLISNTEKVALQNIFLVGESLDGRPPTTALIEKTQEKLFHILFQGKEMAAVINESTTAIPAQFGSNSAAMHHFEAAYTALKKGYSDGGRLAVSEKPIGEWLRDVATYILKNPMRFGDAN